MRYARDEGKGGPGLILCELEMTSLYPNGKSRKAARILGDNVLSESKMGTYRHVFKNGMKAILTLSRVDGHEVKPTISKSWWGYDWRWMLDSISRYGDIRKVEEE